MRASKEANNETSRCPPIHCRCCDHRPLLRRCTDRRRTYRINMKTAKAMNFAVPNNVLSLADEAIE
jgi:hypothetical protein